MEGNWYRYQLTMFDGFFFYTSPPDKTAVGRLVGT